MVVQEVAATCCTVQRKDSVSPGRRGDDTRVKNHERDLNHFESAGLINGEKNAQHLQEPGAEDIAETGDESQITDESGLNADG